MLCLSDVCWSLWVLSQTSFVRTREGGVVCMSVCKSALPMEFRGGEDLPHLLWSNLPGSEGRGRWGWGCRVDVSRGDHREGERLFHLSTVRASPTTPPPPRVKGCPCPSGV